MFLTAPADHWHYTAQYGTAGTDTTERCNCGHPWPCPEVK